MKDQLRLKIQALAIYQLLGGIRGLWISMFLLSINGMASWLLFLYIPLVVALYGYSIYCGIILFTDEEKGLKHSKINQCLQVVYFTAFGYGYQYTSGFFLSIGIDWTDAMILKFNLGLSSFYLNVNTGLPDLLLSINFVAVFLIVFIDRIKLQLKKYTTEKYFSFEDKKEPKLSS
jgi:hypothetical protein